MGLPRIIFDASLFSPFQTDEDAERALYKGLEFLAQANVAYLHANPHTPGLYDLPLRYIREPIGQETWLGIEAIIDAGGADCKSLAAWRVAELRCRYGEDGEDTRGLARFRLEPYPKGRNTIIYHVDVVRGDGTTEDPSAILGMGGVT